MVTTQRICEVTAPHPPQARRRAPTKGRYHGTDRLPSRDLRTTVPTKARIRGARPTNRSLIKHHQGGNHSRQHPQRTACAAKVISSRRRGNGPTHLRGHRPTPTASQTESANQRPLPRHRQASLQRPPNHRSNEGTNPRRATNESKSHQAPSGRKPQQATRATDRLRRKGDQ